MRERTRLRLGWWLFIASAGFFIWASVRAGDWVALAGSLCFLAANIVFMAPLYGGRDRE